MNIVDLIIILLIIFGAVSGFKKGFTRSLVSALGVVAVVVLAFLLKNPVSVFLYEHLPFFEFGGIIKGVTVLNIALYEIIAFLIVAAVLGLILKILSVVTSIFEHLLSITVVLGIPSKILGAVVGALEWFVIVFIALYIINMPFVSINVDEVRNSQLTPTILNSTPLLSNAIEDTTKVIDEFTVLKDKYKDSDVNTNEFNRETLDLFLKYNVVTVKSVDKLVEDNKLKITGIEDIISKYRNGEN